MNNNGTWRRINVTVLIKEDSQGGFRLYMHFWGGVLINMQRR